MSRRVIITGPAELDVHSNYEWWAKNKSEHQAKRWLEGIYQKMLGLADDADMYALAMEVQLKKIGVKQVSFGLGISPTHRILFRIQQNNVIILRVRAFKQDAIDTSELTG